MVTRAKRCTGDYGHDGGRMSGSGQTDNGIEGQWTLLFPDVPRVSHY